MSDLDRNPGGFGGAMTPAETAAIDAGAHIFVRRHQSFDITGRVFHLSNAYLGPSNPGIPVGLQFAVGYTWY